MRRHLNVGHDLLAAVLAGSADHHRLHDFRMGAEHAFVESASARACWSIR